MAPRRWRAVVAEVPFVDCVTTMLDPGIPLTIGEWDEWGDPRDPDIRAYMESYSPYDNVPPGAPARPAGHREPARPAGAYPRTGQVGRQAPGHRHLRQPASFRPELGAGAHVGPAGRYDRLRYAAGILAFIVAAVA
jgi:oligopeptidase B